jgi:hypothetical protein
VKKFVAAKMRIIKAKVKARLIAPKMIHIRAIFGVLWEVALL